MFGIETNRFSYGLSKRRESLLFVWSTLGLALLLVILSLTTWLRLEKKLWSDVTFFSEGSDGRINKSVWGRLVLMEGIEGCLIIFYGF